MVTLAKATTCLGIPKRTASADFCALGIDLGADQHRLPCCYSLNHPPGRRESMLGHLWQAGTARQLGLQLVGVLGGAGHDDQTPSGRQEDGAEGAHPGGSIGVQSSGLAVSHSVI